MSSPPAKIARISAACAAALLATTAMPASAATFLFDFEGDGGRSFTFTLDDERAPDDSTFFNLGGGSTRITFRNVAGTFVGANGTNDVANISFGTGIFGALQVGAINFAGVFRGPELFDGSRTDPQFNTGQFELTGGALTPFGGTLTVSQVAAVPEPATWAMMLLGFFGIGGLMRAKPAVRRRALSYS